MSSTLEQPSRARSDTAATWTRKLARFRRPGTRRALLELAVTVAPFLLLWGAMSVAVILEAWWLYALLLLPTAGLLVRLFMIQHDCGHESFFPNSRANHWVGRAIGVLTLTPYDHWRRTHAVHHACAGNLDRRGIGDVDTLTTDEYLALGPWARLRYRLYRHPLVMFGIGPSFLFVLQNRLPLGFMRKGWMPWASAMGTNAALLALAAAAIWAVGLPTFLIVHLPLVVLGATAGVWLFFIQHQFEDTHWEGDTDWRFHDAALHGSSHYDLPPVLRWFTANIGIHHVHHLASRIPFYRLPEVLREHPELSAIGRVTLLESFKCVRLTLWDTVSRRMVSFRELNGGFQLSSRRLCKDGCCLNRRSEGKEQILGASRVCSVPPPSALP